MHSLLPAAPDWFADLLTLSWHATILVVIVGTLQRVFRNRLSPNWKQALWALVLIKLTLPIVPQSAASLYNYLPSPTVPPPAQDLSASPSRPATIEPVRSDSDPIDRASRRTLNTATPTTPFTANQPDFQKEPFRTARTRTAAESSPSKRFSWLDLAFLVWLVGVSGLSLQLAIRNARFTSRLRQSPPCQDAMLLRLIRSCESIVGLHHSIPVQLTDQVRTPAVYGVFRPTLLIPSPLIQQLTEAQLRYVILHELVHIRRRDTALNAWCAMLNILHWFNPFLALAFARFRQEREYATDATVISLTGKESRFDYGEAILRLLEQPTHPHGTPGLVGILENRRHLAARMQRINGFRIYPKASFVAGALLLAVSLITLTDAQTNTNPKTIVADNPSAPPTLILHLKDRNTKQPIARAKTVANLARSWKWENHPGTESVPGTYHYQWENRPDDAIRLGVLAEGYPVTMLTWRGDEGSPPPPEYTLEMDPAWEIGGTIVAPDGTPIPSAQIEVHFSGVGDSSHRATQLVRFGFIDYDFLAVTSDSNGRWRFPHVPPDFPHFTVHVSHPNYVETVFVPDTNPSNTVSTNRIRMAALKAREAQFLMQPGESLEGRIVDFQENPIANAQVAIGRWWSNNPSRLRSTDTDGAFQFTPLKPGSHTLTVMAEGYSPNRVIVELKPNSQPTTIRLGPPGIISGRVVDPSGAPVAGVRMVVQGWRGNNSIDWKQSLGPDGRFEWGSAPLGESVDLYFGARNYFHKRRYIVTPNATDLTVTLEPRKRVRGRVTDAVTGNPVANFKTIPGYTIKEGYRWHTGSTRPGKNGQLDMQYDEFEPPFSLRVEADGYEPYISPNWPDTGDVSDLDVRLQPIAAEKQQTIQGSVRTPEGNPAANAQVFLAADQRHIALTPAGFAPTSDAVITRTGADGAFTFEAEPKARKLFVWHETGFAETQIENFRKTKQIQLGLWSSLEGHAKTMTQPVVGKRIHINEGHRFRSTTPSLAYLNESLPITDDLGHFQVDRIRPGVYHLSVSQGLGKPSTHTTPVILEAGTHTRIQLGGVGWTVEGRFETSPSDLPVKWTHPSSSVAARLSKRVSRIPYPRDLKREDQQAWLRTYWNSDEGQERTLRQRYYPIFPSADGSFQIRDVLPGEYDLRVTLHQPSANRFPISAPLATLHHVVTIPELTTPNPKEPQDLGTLTITARR